MSKWMLKRSPVLADNIIKSLNINPIVARILNVRGYRTVQAVHDFLFAENHIAASVWEFADMERAVRIVDAAINSQKKITIFGDYDADGIMSTVILNKTLSSLGYDSDFYIPDREREGYGLNNDAIKKLYDSGTQLIIACDNGIAAIDQVEYANSLGIDIVILDHHALPLCEKDENHSMLQIMPNASAVVDPKRDDCLYPFNNYCAAGICYRFSEAMYLYMNKNWHKLSQELLPFATIATICDMVDLTEENRSLVKRGLSCISDSDNLGIKSLFFVTGLIDKKISTYHIGYIIGPCINASGRLDVASVAVELFLTEDTDVALKKASFLLELNNCRRVLTEEGTASALEIIKQENLDKNKVILVYANNISESVAGIIAGRIKEKFSKPTIVIAGNKQILRGSCRSIEGYNIFNALNECADILVAFGGHPLAAGFTIDRDNICDLSIRLNQQCVLSEDDMLPILRIDKLLPIEEVNIQLAKDMECFEPLGKGNPNVYFADKKLHLCKVVLVGKSQQYLKLYFKIKNGAVIDAISFTGKEKLMDLICAEIGYNGWQDILSGNTTKKIYLDIVYMLSINIFNDRESAQIKIIDFRLANDSGR